MQLRRAFLRGNEGGKKQAPWENELFQERMREFKQLLDEVFNLGLISGLNKVEVGVVSRAEDGG